LTIINELHNITAAF